MTVRRPARLALILLGYVVFWWLLHPVLSPRDAAPSRLPLSDHAAVTLDVAPADTAMLTPAGLRTVLDTLTLPRVTTPWRVCGPARVHVVRTTATVASIPPEGYGVLPRVQADNAWLFVNGQFVAGDGSLAPQRPGRIQLRTAWHVPAGAWRVGPNRIDVVATMATAPCVGATGVWIAPWFTLRAWISWRHLLERDIAWIAVAITSVLALLGFTLWRRGNRERTLGWATVMLSAWSAMQLNGVAPSALPFVVRASVLTGTRLLLLLALVKISEAPMSTPNARWRTVLHVGVPVAGLIEILLLLAASNELGLLQWRVYSLALDLLLVSVAIACGLRRVIKEPTVLDARAPETLVLSLLLSVLALEPLRELFRVGSMGDLSASFALLAIALALLFAARTATEYRSASQVTQLLTSRLTAKEAELAVLFAEQRESARQQARLEERTRLMRDMHDGIGGRLLSLEAQLRQSPEPPAATAVADELRGALDELRLIVDSLDTAGDDLGVALGAFRGRMAPRLRAAGLVLEWSVDDAATTPPLSTSAVLDVYRILQEACTNVLRHARATHVRVSLRREPDGTRVLELSDNGVGVPSDADTRGRGFANMRARAARLGGRLTRRDSGSGTTLQLELPPVPTA